MPEREAWGVGVYVEESVEGAAGSCPDFCCHLSSFQKYTLRLECSLPKSQYDFVDPEVSFTANISFKHYTFRFEPKVRLHYLLHRS